MLIGWRIVNVFPILFGKCRPAFVDHSRQDHEPAQPDAKAARLKFASRRSRYQSRPGKIIYDLTLGSGFVGSAKADLLGSDFPWLESEYAAVPLLLSVPPR